MRLFGEYLTAQEIAAAAARLGARAMPQTKRGVQVVITRENWDASPLCRKRGGVEGGGGNEYHYTLLPLALQTALLAAHARGQQLVAVGESQARELVVQDKLAISDLSARQRGVMEARAGVLREVEGRMLAQGVSQRRAIMGFLADLAAGRLNEIQQRLAERANDKGRGLSRGTVARWFRLRELGGLVALAPRKTREVEAVPVWMGAFLKYYRQPQTPSVSHAYEMWKRGMVAGAVMPSLAQVRHALSKLSEIDRQRGRMGSRELKSLKAYRSRDVSDLLVGSVYVADGKRFDAEIAHPIHGNPFKPELTTIIDAKTRAIVGWSAALDENAHAVIDALLMACHRSGIPAIFYSDNGPGYKNKKMEDPLVGFLERLGITPYHATAYNSQAKGVIERFNRQWTDLSREMPTYIGRDMDKQAAQMVHKHTRKDIKETGVSRLLPSWACFLEACNGLIERYNNRPHRGLEKIFDEGLGKRRHLTPNEMWTREVEGGFAPPRVEASEVAELRQPWVIRRVSRCLVTWNDNRYFAEELEAYHGQDVIIAYDIHDGREVTVREISLNDEGERVPGRMIGVARFEGHKTRFVPLSAEQKALEDRHRGRVARLDRKRADADAELRAVTLEGYVVPDGISHFPVGAAPLHASCALPPPVPFIEGQALQLVGGTDVEQEAWRAESPKRQDKKGKPPDPPPLKAQQPPPQQSSVPRLVGGRPNFKSDADYAFWLIENPDKITEQDRANIREDLLATQTLKTLLQRQGVDLSELGRLARSAA